MKVPTNNHFLAELFIAAYFLSSVLTNFPVFKQEMSDASSSLHSRLEVPYSFTLERADFVFQSF